MSRMIKYQEQESNQADAVNSASFSCMPRSSGLCFGGVLRNVFSGLV